MGHMWKESVKAFIDLTRLHFGFAWPLLFSSGVFLAFWRTGSFDWIVLLKAVFIGFFGFETGFVLNDLVDRERDKKDIDSKLTNYWRLFKRRPISEGLISAKKAFVVFVVFLALTTLLILSLPPPHSFYVFIAMIYCYSMEFFYQMYKRKERYPIAQLLGRTDFALFPVAGYLVVGHPDVIALLYFLFFYPFAIAHLGANDLIDIENDKARKMHSVTVLYGIQGTIWWILCFTLIHFITAVVFAAYLGWFVLIGFSVGFVLLLIANRTILQQKTPAAALKVLPCFHVTMIIYSISLLLVAIFSLF
jgi:4-hydroxybenzoate polyprenyltransferase